MPRFCGSAANTLGILHVYIDVVVALAKHDAIGIFFTDIHEMPTARIFFQGLHHGEMLRLFSDQCFIIRSDDLSVNRDKNSTIRQRIVPCKQTLDHERVSSGILSGCVLVHDDDARLVHASAGSHIDIGPIREAKTLRIDFLRITGAGFHDISG